MLGDTPRACSASMNALAISGVTSTNSLMPGLRCLHERHEPLEDRRALGDVVFARSLTPRDLQPQLGQLRQLGEPGRLTGLDLDQLPECRLRVPVEGELLLLAIVRFLGAAPGSFELIVAEHRSLGRSFTGDRDAEVDDRLLAVDHPTARTTTYWIF